MAQTIITGWECIKYGFVHPDYPVDYVCDHIPRIEQKLFRKCYLGISTYYALLNDLEDYSDVAEYNIESTYALNDLICYNGMILKSTCEDNEAHPGDDPEKCWEIAPKFKSDCNNALWDTNMKYWLAYEVCHTSLDYSTYPVAANGATKKADDTTGIKTVDKEEFKQLKRKSRHDADDHLENMLDWMVEQTQSTDTNCAYTHIQAVADKCCSDNCIPFKQRRRRRIYFRN